jgi:chemotaxis protein histidine kinase CheA
VGPLVLAAPIVGVALTICALAILAYEASPIKGTTWVAVAAVAGAFGLLLAGWGLITRARGESTRYSNYAQEVELQNGDLWRNSRELAAAKEEADTILEHVRAHLMLIDSSYLIQSRYSNELETVFRQTELGNENFLNVLQRLLSERMFKTSRDYLALLFDPSKKERTILKINPLDEVEVSVESPTGSTTLRYLSFGFRRIVQNDVITRVLISVEDVTERAVRERQLRDSEQQKVKQFELLIGIIHVDPASLDGFVTSTQDQLAIVDEALKVSDFASATVGQTALLRQRLDLVAQRVHNIKGNATLLGLDHFERKAAEFEQKIFDLKNRPALGGDDFLAVVIGLADFRSDLDDLQTLRGKLAGIQRAARIRKEGGDDLVASVSQLAKQLGHRLGKEVRVDADGFDTRALPPERRLIVKDILIQLTRNSLTHGCEDPATREAAGKPPTCIIDIHPMADAPPETFSFSFRDDGRGLDPYKIRQRAVEQGIFSSERARAVDDSEVAGVIFTPGFSTVDETTNEAGRGMGMNIIKQLVVDECGGEIFVNSEVGQFCEFSFVLPVQAPELAHR